MSRREGIHISSSMLGVCYLELCEQAFSVNNRYILYEMITYLTIGFVLLLLGAALYGFGIVMRRPPTQEELETESCTLCRQRINKEKLVERQIGDYKVLFFCSDCIEKLAAESSRQNGRAGATVEK